MKKIGILAVMFFVFATAQPALPAEEGSGTGPVSVSAKAGTLGVGIAGEYRMSDAFGLALGGNYFRYDFEITTDEIDYDAELKLGSVVFLGNYYPTKSRFRLTGGLAFNGNEIDAQSQDSVLLEVGDTVYTTAQVGTIDGKIDFNSVAPYLGLGWGADPQKRWGFTFDIGVLFQGSPDVSLTASGLLADDPAFQADLEEEEQEIEDELKNFQYYPVIALGLFYRF